MAQWVGRQFAQPVVTVTSSGLAVNFGIQARQVVINCDGAGSLFVDFTTSSSIVATSSASYQIKTGEKLTLTMTEKQTFITGFNCTCSSAGTAALRALALVG